MNNLYISMYHYTRDLAHSRYPGIKGLDYALFEEQLRFFKEHFHPVTMEEVLSAVERGTRLPENALLLTFDDGYIDNFTVAFPLLTKYDLQGSFFIPGKTFTEDKVLDVNKIHFLLASVSGEELKRELLRLMDELRNDTGGGINQMRSFTRIMPSRNALIQRIRFLSSECFRPCFRKRFARRSRQCYSINTSEFPRSALRGSSI